MQKVFLDGQMDGRMDIRRINRVLVGGIEMDLTDCHSGIYLLMIDGKAVKISKR